MKFCVNVYILYVSLSSLALLSVYCVRCASTHLGIDFNFFFLSSDFQIWSKRIKFVYAFSFIAAAHSHKSFGTIQFRIRWAKWFYCLTSIFTFSIITFCGPKNQEKEQRKIQKLSAQMKQLQPWCKCVANESSQISPSRAIDAPFLFAILDECWY